MYGVLIPTFSVLSENSNLYLLHNLAHPTISALNVLRISYSGVVDNLIKLTAAEGISNLN